MLQKPHCSAPSSAKHKPNSSASLSSPSRVSTVAPSTSAARTAQDNTDLLFKITVQSPQLVVSHPHLTL